MANKVLHMLHSLDVKPGDIGITVRRGDKWLSVTQGEQLDLCVCVPDHVIVDKGYVNFTWYGKFKDIPARYLELEHEVESRTYSGLLKSMRRAYGFEFNENEQVTVLGYVRQNV